jgi:AraC-like DNA-binding protein
VAGGHLTTLRFDFAFGCPPHASSYDKVFPVPLKFDQRQSAFWFDALLLKKPVRRNEAALREFLADAQTYIILPRRNDDTGSAWVRHQLQQTQPAWPDLDPTAAALHLSSSTLQRRLASEGASFQSLKDALRRDIAIVYLSTRTLPLAALAGERGFADSAAFQRAFKGWTGSAPGA